MQQHFADQKDRKTHNESMIRFFEYQQNFQGDAPVHPKFFCIPYTIESDCYQLLRIYQFLSVCENTGFPFSIKLVKLKKGYDKNDFETKFNKITNRKIKIAKGKDKKLYAKTDEIIPMALLYQHDKQLAIDYLKDWFNFDWKTSDTYKQNMKQLGVYLKTRETNLKARIEESTKKYMPQFALLTSSVDKLLEQLEYLFDNHKKFKFRWTPFFSRKSECIKRTGVSKFRDFIEFLRSRNGFLLPYEYKQLYKIVKENTTLRRHLEEKEMESRDNKRKKKIEDAKKIEKVSLKNKQQYVRTQVEKFSAWMEVGYLNGTLTEEFFEKSLSNLKKKVEGSLNEKEKVKGKDKKKRKRSEAEEPLKKKKKLVLV